MLLALPGAAVADVITGTAFSSVTEIDPETVGVCLLTARIVTWLGDGTFAGGVYTPAREIVPAPVDGLTLHIAVWFVVPMNLAP